MSNWIFICIAAWVASLIVVFFAGKRHGQKVADPANIFKGTIGRL